MKKIGTVLLMLILSVIVFLFIFDYKGTHQPHVYYQVYLDDELIGIIESKKELEDYINFQANTIKSNVKEYNLILESIDTFKKYGSGINIEGYSVLDKVNFLITNKNSYNLNNLDIENLNFYKQNKLILKDFL